MGASTSGQSFPTRVLRITSPLTRHNNFIRAKDVLAFERNERNSFVVEGRETTGRKSSEKRTVRASNIQPSGTSTGADLKRGECVLEVPNVENRQLQLDVAVVPRAVHQQLAEDRSEDRFRTTGKSRQKTRTRSKNKKCVHHGQGRTAPPQGGVFHKIGRRARAEQRSVRTEQQSATDIAANGTGEKRATPKKQVEEKQEREPTSAGKETNNSHRETNQQPNKRERTKGERKPRRQSCQGVAFQKEGMPARQANGDGMLGNKTTRRTEQDIA